MKNPIILGVVALMLLAGAGAAALTNAASISDGCAELDGRNDMSEGTVVYHTYAMFTAGQVITVTIFEAAAPVEVYFAGALKGTIPASGGSLTFTVPATGAALFEVLLVDSLGVTEWAFACQAGGAGHASAAPKPLFTDGRVCANAWAWAAIYADSSGIHIYRINGSGQGALAVYASPEMLAALPATPTENLTIQTDDQGIFIGLYRLQGDHEQQYQVNVGPDAEGKVFTCLWHGLPSERSQAFEWNVNAP